jgi:hypothetical protein
VSGAAGFGDDARPEREWTMGKTNVSDHAAQGDAILERFATTGVPAALRAPLAAFKQAHAAFTSAGKLATAAMRVRDDALGAVAAADGALDAAVEGLAAKMAGAQMGSRANPFAGYAKAAPSKMVVLAYANEIAEVRKLCAKVAKAKPPADVAKAIAACTKLASGVEAAIAKVTGPQLKYARALGARDALLLPWTKALSRLKTLARAAWVDDPAQVKAVFAPPERLADPAPRPRAASKKKPAPPAPPPPAPPPPGKPVAG